MSAERHRFIDDVLFNVDDVKPGQGLAKHQKMALSPFVFLRGSAPLFYADLKHGHLPTPKLAQRMPLTTIMGDCHISNFGFLTEEGSHGDQVIFSPNDFDDACIGHAIWDLMRFCVSLMLTVDHCQGISSGRYRFTDTTIDKPVVTEASLIDAIDEFFGAYLTVCQQALSDAQHLQDAITDIDHSSKLHKLWQKARERAAGGEAFLTKSALAKSVTLQDGVLGFAHKPDKFSRLSHTQYDTLNRAFAPYMDDKVLDIVTRLNAGTGSVNMQRYYFLVGPQHPIQEKHLVDCHIVEVKQQRIAAPLFYFDDLSVVNQLNPAHLTARCQRRMQRKPDLLLDEVAWQGEHFLIRSRHHARVGIDPIDIACGNKALKGGFARYAAYCGEALALAHCRGDRRTTRFETAAVSTIPFIKNELVDACYQYADQVVNDHAYLVSRENSV